VPPAVSASGIHPEADTSRLSEPVAAAAAAAVVAASAQPASLRSTPACTRPWPAPRKTPG